MVMSEQVQARKRERADKPSRIKAKQTAEIEDRKAISNDLLDAIDLILEENAEEFVRSYVQTGGQ